MLIRRVWSLLLWLLIYPAVCFYTSCIKGRDDDDDNDDEEFKNNNNNNNNNVEGT